MCAAKPGISEASYYNWKAKFGGMEASDIKKMKDLEDEKPPVETDVCGPEPRVPRIERRY
ncbi:transposase [Klebsiella pneumoniae]|nr:transposase [Klebsiella pneumoniae]